MASASIAPVLEIVACRGCCCGSRRKHPACDHVSQLAAIRAAVAAVPGARLVVTGCLELCRHSNLVALADRRGPESAVTWLGGMLEAADTAALVCHLVTGGPLPGRLRGRRFCPERPFPLDLAAGSAPRRP